MIDEPTEQQYVDKLVNPAFVIKGMDKNKSFRLMINDEEFRKFRAGFEDDNL